MTFGEFAFNYINPIILLYRATLLFAAYAGFFLITNHFHYPEFVAYAYSVICFWVAVKPWGKGKSMNDVNNDIERLKRKYR